MNIYVGNLDHEVTEEELRNEFARFGQVTSVSIIKDKYTGQSKGFAFIEMPVIAEGQAAITGLKNTGLHERTLDVSEARPRPDNRSRSSWDHKGGGRGYGGGKTGGYGDRRKRF